MGVLLRDARHSQADLSHLQEAGVVA